MTRPLHGQYNIQRHLPDNRMQAVGSGLYVWLQEEVLRQLPDEGEQLLQEAAQYGTKRYIWLCHQLQNRGHQETVDAYLRKKKEGEAEKRRRDRELQRDSLRLQRAQEQNPARQRFLEREIAKCDRYLKQRPGTDRKSNGNNDENQK